MITYTILAILSVGCLCKILHFSIQDGQWLDKLFGWQTLLQGLAEKGSFWSKPLGHCEMCFCHLVTLLSFPVYLAFMAQLGFVTAWWVGLIMYFCFVPCATICGLYITSRLFNK